MAMNINICGWVVDILNFKFFMNISLYYEYSTVCKIRNHAVGIKKNYFHNVCMLCKVFVDTKSGFGYLVNGAAMLKAKS